MPGSHSVASFPGGTNRLFYVPKMSGKTEALDLVPFEAGRQAVKTANLKPAIIIPRTITFYKLLGVFIVVSLGWQLRKANEFDGGSLIGEAQQYDPPMRMILSVNLVAEILVTGDQYPVLAARYLNHLIICDSPALLIDRKNFVALFAKPLSNPRAGAFVYEKTH
jgi:hypothetical protein